MPFRDRIKKIKQPKCAEKAAFYAGCLVDFAYPEMGEAVVKVLNKAGIEVVFPEGQTCCGAPARYSGAYEVAAQNGADNIDALLAEDVKYVVSACPTCTVALKAGLHRQLRKPWAAPTICRSQAARGKGRGLLHPGEASSSTRDG